MQAQSTNEQWRPIADWPYEVSDHGAVRRTTAASGTRAGRVLKPRLYRNGYAYVGLCQDNVKRWVQVHRLVALAFHGELRGKAEVNHKDGDKRNNVASNLEFVSQQENMRHAARLGLLATGERHYAARLTAEQVREIRRRTQQGESQRAIARHFSVSRSAIIHILSGKNWKALT